MKTHPQLVVVLLTSLGALSGCAVEMVEPNLCADARAHVQSCMGLDAADVLVPSSCDPDAADAILAQPCESLAGPGKADFFGRFLCRLGLLRYCSVPICESPGAFDPDVPESCGALIELDGCGQCDYYACREARSTAACGDAGYYLGFGRRYCSRYQQVTEGRLSRAGEAWSARVRPCLMRALEATTTDETTCEDLQQLAFDSHPACYLDAGFCSLPISDWILILNTIDPADVDLRQILTTGLDCLAAALAPGGALDR